MSHVTLVGDRTGEYVITEERPDGSLVLEPDISSEATLRRHALKPATVEEFEQAAGVKLKPPDGEG